MEPLTGRAARDQNRAPVTFGVSSADGVTVLPIEINPSNGELLVSSAGSSNATIVSPIGQTTMSGSVAVAIASNQSAVPISGTVTATPAALPSTEVNGQTTGTTAGTAVQFASNALVNGVIVQALSTNATSVYIGTSSVSSSNGFELQPGQATSVGVSNTNAVWVVSTTNGDKVCWIGS